MTLHPSQAAVARDRHRFRICNCGRRWGKTVLAVEEIKGKALAKPSRIAYIAPTYQQARDIAWEMLKKELTPIALQINESRLEIRVRTVGGGESLIVLRGWESIESLRGQFFDFVVVDEIAMLRNWWTGWSEVLRPTLTDKHGEGLFISTPKGFNHFYDLCNTTDTDYAYFHFTSYDNPFIPKEELDKAHSEVGEDRFSQEFMAEFRKMSGLVYKEFSRDAHLYETLPERYYTRCCGVDFGYTNPTALALVLEDKFGNYWVEDEWYKTEQLNAQIVAGAKAFKPHYTYPDPEAPEKVKELSDAGLTIMTVVKGRDSIRNGIVIVKDLLATGRLRVNKRCANIIMEFEMYRWRDQRHEVTKEEDPEPENNHLLDALRYVVMSRKRIDPFVTVKKNITFEGEFNTY